MHREDIKAALRKEHGSLRAFEAKVGLAVGSVRDTLRGRISKPTATVIAEALGKPVDKVFPNRFVDRGGQDKSRKRDAHGLNSGAA